MQAFSFAGLLSAKIRLCEYLVGNRYEHDMDTAMAHEVEADCVAYARVCAPIQVVLGMYVCRSLSTAMIALQLYVLVPGGVLECRKLVCGPDR
jgi:hypothetical protein